MRNLVRAGVGEKVAMALAGFKTRFVFDRYDIVSEADLSAGVEKLAKRNSAAQRSGFPSNNRHTERAGPRKSLRRDVRVVEGARLEIV